MSETTMKIAITGGIAEGKSTILQYIQEAGVETLSADEIAKDILDQQDAQEEVALKLNIELPIDRKKLLKLIAEDKKKRSILDQIMHPKILSVIKKSHISIVEVPLLYETNTEKYFDQVWVVTSGTKEQKKRLLKRLKDELLVDNLLKTQWPTEKKAARADKIINTNLPESCVKQEVLLALKEVGFDIRK